MNSKMKIKNSSKVISKVKIKKIEIWLNHLSLWTIKVSKMKTEEKIKK
jgi:hypothetical protein